MPLPPDLRLRLTAPVLPLGRLLGGSPRVLLHADPHALQRLADGAPAEEHAELARRLLGSGLARVRTVRAHWTLKDVTAIVPVKDDARRLPAALASLKGVAEVIVVDDGSTDDSAEVARAAGATVVRHSTSRGPAAARNAGLAAARTALVAMVDADVAAEEGWLEALLPALEDPESLLVAPRVLGPERTGGGLVERYERAQSALDRGPAAGLVGPGRQIGFVAAAALVARRDGLQALGGFDQRLRLGEDVDLCARAAAAGWLLHYAPDVVVRHDHRTSWAGFLRRRFQYGTSGAVLSRLHPGLLPATSAGGWLAVALLAVGAPRRLPVLAAAAVAGGSAARTAGLLLRHRVPPVVAIGTAVRTEAEAARRFVGTAARYTGLPLTVALAVRSRRARILLLTGVVLHARDHRRLRPELALVPFALLRVLDEGAVGIGLWSSCLRSRTPRPFDPRLAVLPRSTGDLLTWEGAARAR